MIAEVVSMKKEVSNSHTPIRKIQVYFLSFDEFLSSYTVDSEGKGIISVYLDAPVNEKEELSISLGLRKGVPFLETKGKIIRILEETADRRRTAQIELNHFNEQGEKLLVRLIEIQNQ